MKSFEEYASFYKKELTENVMDFWDERCIDYENGGYFTCFDRFGNLTDTNKYIWFQGRQLYVYSLLYNRIEKKKEWLDKAWHGYRFLVEKAYAGNGRWHYILDQKGTVIEGAISIFSDYHVIQGLAEFALASADEGCKSLLEECFDVLEENMFDPNFKEIYENTWHEDLIWHDMYLTCLSTVESCIPVLGIERTRRLFDDCIEKITQCFYDKNEKKIFEAIKRNGGNAFDYPQGTFINPGHSYESLWFIMNIGVGYNKPELVKWGLDTVKEINQYSLDKDYGGVYSYLDLYQKDPEPIDWYKETNTLWHDKVWWCNVEALCCLALAYSISPTAECENEFIKLQEFCFAHFSDREYGEWYERLDRAGYVKNSDKGTPWKCAFHLARALVFIYTYFSNASLGKQEIES